MLLRVGGWWGVRNNGGRDKRSHKGPYRYLDDLIQERIAIFSANCESDGPTLVPLMVTYRYMAVSMPFIFSGCDGLRQCMSSQILVQLETKATIFNKHMSACRKSCVRQFRPEVADDAFSLSWI